MLPSLLTRDDLEKEAIDELCHSGIVFNVQVSVKRALARTRTLARSLAAATGDRQHGASCSQVPSR